MAKENSFGTLAQRGDGGKKSAPATVAVSSSIPTLLIAANGNRASAVIQNLHATTTLYIGNSNTLTAANGIALAPSQGWEDSASTDAWYGLQASGTGDARVFEVTR